MRLSRGGRGARRELRAFGEREVLRVGVMSAGVGEYRREFLSGKYMREEYK